MAKIRILLLSLAIVLAHYGVSQAQRYIPDPDVYGKIRGAYQPSPWWPASATTETWGATLSETIPATDSATR
jgi:hypothetical protein